MAATLSRPNFNGTIFAGSKYHSLINSYSLFMLSIPKSQNRKYYIIGMYVYYILLVYHVNAISTSCSRVICRHCLLSFRFRFYCLLWTHSWRSLLLLIPLLIYFVAVPPCRGKDVLLVVKKRSFCNVYFYFEQLSKKQKVATLLKYNKETAEATSFTRRTVDKVRKKRSLVEDHHRQEE